MGPLHSPLVEDHVGVLRRVFVAFRRCGVVIGADLVAVDDSSLLRSFRLPPGRCRSSRPRRCPARGPQPRVVLDSFQTRCRCPHPLLHFGWILLYSLLILQFARWGRRRTVVVLHAVRIFSKGLSPQYSFSWRLRSRHSPPLTSVFLGLL